MRCEGVALILSAKNRPRSEYPGAVNLPTTQEIFSTGLPSRPRLPAGTMTRGRRLISLYRHGNQSATLGRLRGFGACHLAEPAVDALIFLTSDFPFGLHLWRISTAFHDQRAAMGSEFMAALKPLVRIWISKTRLMSAITVAGLNRS